LAETPLFWGGFRNTGKDKQARLCYTLLIKAVKALDYHSAMELCEKYIKEHIGETISAKVLADRTGYSLYHFCHVFRAYFDMPVGEYVRRCALHKAALEILGGKSITEAAFDAGFSTSAGFSKAFKKRYGTSAVDYRKQNMKWRRDNMNVVIETKEKFSAIGYHIPSRDGGKVNPIEAGAYWFGVDFKSHPQYPTDSSLKGEIGTWTHPDDLDGNLNYFFGYIAADENTPEGFAKLDVPAAEYAVFDVPPVTNFSDNSEAFAGEIRKTWKYIFKDWFDASEYFFDEAKVCFEFYHGESTKIYVPVKPKA